LKKKKKRKKREEILPLLPGKKESGSPASTQPFLDENAKNRNPWGKRKRRERALSPQKGDRSAKFLLTGEGKKREEMLIFLQSSS